MTPRAYLLTGDLFFRVKIETAANAAGIELLPVSSTEAIPTEEVDLVIVDLAGTGADPIRALKARAGPPRVVAFGSHQDREGLQGAKAAGADAVMARSTFVERLPDLLTGLRAGKGAESGG